jgi:hypothetical protein
VAEIDHELEFLLSLDGQEFRFRGDYRVKLEARRVKTAAERPAGIKYSLTLHDPDGHRVYGLDNAHGIRRQRAYDHRHVYGVRKMAPYEYRGAAMLLEDFYREVERILEERGVR